LTDFFGGDALVNLRDHLLPGLWPLLVAFVICVVLVPLMIRIARRIGLISQPGGHHSHATPTPLLGGLAMYAGFAGAVTVFMPRNGHTFGVLVITGLAALLLLIDDRRPMPALVKFGLQLAVVAVAIAFGQDFWITFFGLPGGHIVQLGILAVPVTVFWFLGMQNTVNFLDGVDGLAAGVVFIVAITLMLAAGGRGQMDAVQLAGALAGTCAGFLIFNFHPARIFMGDSGSHFLGTAVAVVSILGVAKVEVAFALVVPVLVLGLPIADTAWAIIRRRWVRASVARPDQAHLHHRLQAFGLDARQTCYVFYTTTALLGALALTVFGHGRVLAVALVASAALASTVAADLLQRTAWRIPMRGLQRLLAKPGTR
jgi:UDP-GlcNAc:undecaprenyl-phosphate GlcNAc-1-phosphate transferase